MRHEISEEPARRGSQSIASLCLDRPTENMDALSPVRIAHAHEMHEKAGSINTLIVPIPHFRLRLKEPKAPLLL